jgi:hypothetical protein
MFDSLGLPGAGTWSRKSQDLDFFPSHTSVSSSKIWEPGVIRSRLRTQMARRQAMLVCDRVCVCVCVCVCVFEWGQGPG